MSLVGVAFSRWCSRRLRVHGGVPVRRLLDVLVCLSRVVLWQRRLPRRCFDEYGCIYEYFVDVFLVRPRSAEHGWTMSDAFVSKASQCDGMGVDLRIYLPARYSVSVVLVLQLGLELMFMSTG